MLWGAMGGFLDNTWLTCGCPRCGYLLEFTFLQARLQEVIICPCCKSDVALTDPDASLEGAKRDVDRALNEFRNAVKVRKVKIKVRF